MCPIHGDPVSMAWWFHVYKSLKMIIVWHGSLIGTSMTADSCCFTDSYHMLSIAIMFTGKPLSFGGVEMASRYLSTEEWNWEIFNDAEIADSGRMGIHDNPPL